MMFLRNKRSLLFIYLILLPLLGSACGGKSTTSTSDTTQSTTAGTGGSPESPESSGAPGGGGSSSSSPGGGGQDTTNPKTEKSCTTSNDCKDVGGVCRENKCVDLSGDLCKSKILKCKPDEECKGNVCIPKCDQELCGGVCCGAGEICFEKQCVAPCSNPSEIPCSVDSTTGAPICCGDSGKSCLNRSCVTEHSSCDNVNSYCPITQYCDTTSFNGSCISYKEAKDLCLYQKVEQFSPELKLFWEGSKLHETGSKHVMTTPLVIDVDGDSIPEIIFTSFSPSVLRVIKSTPSDPSDPTSVVEMWTSSALTENPFSVHNLDVSAAGVLTDDGEVYIVASSSNEGIIAVRGKDGKRLWTQKNARGGGWSAIAIADLDRDGKPEVLTRQHVLNGQTGKILCEFPYSNNIPLAADVISSNSNMEIIRGRAIYTFEKDGASFKCSRVPTSATSSSGFAAVADILKDRPGPEIAVVESSTLYLLDNTGFELWRFPLSGVQSGGAPTLADFDGDDELEIGIADALAYYVVEPSATSGTLRWKFTTQDASSGQTGSSVFDFDGDGKAEVVYNDEVYIRILDGEGHLNPDGTPKGTSYTRFVEENSNNTGIDNPVIADVDNDGHADIVACANKLGGRRKQDGIRVFSDKKWVATRALWNQHTYHYTNINDDGTIPQFEKNHWEEPWSNNFRQNPQKGNASLAPNLSVDLDTIYEGTCSSTTNKNINFTLYNKGNRDIEVGKVKLKVSVSEHGADAWTQVGTLLTNTKLLKGSRNVDNKESFKVPWNIDPSLSGKLLDVKVEADPNDEIAECFEDDNTATLIGVSATAPNLFPVLSSSSAASCDSSGELNVHFELHNNGANDVEVDQAVVSIHIGLKGEAPIHSGTLKNTTKLTKDGFEAMSYRWKVPTNLVNRGLEVRIVVDEAQTIHECSEKDNEVVIDQNVACYLLG